MTVKEVRLARLGDLLREHDDNKAALARTLKKAPAQVSQWFAGIRTITEETAREIELLAKKPKGWMDSEVGDDFREEVTLVVDDALRRLGPDARRDALEYIRYRIERQDAPNAQELLARYDALLRRLDDQGDTPGAEKH